MNQFKMAKQSGHQTESITDLQRAGVTKQEALNKTDAIQEKEITVEEHKIISSEIAESEIKEAAASENGNPQLVEQPPLTAGALINTSAYDGGTSREQPDYTTSQPVIIPDTQQQFSGYESAYTKSVSAVPNNDSKKNAPNMFSRKGESKSIRKSLVLRPSSVKIAENYCAQNGGSFNELIQILLDKFIEEYGL